MLSKRLCFAVVTGFLVFFAFFVSYAHSARIQLSWAAPTKNADGTALTDLAGYKLYYGQYSRQVNGVYEYSMDVGNLNSYTITSLTDGTLYYFAVTAYDTSKNESAYSNEASGTASSPPVPTGLVAAYSFNEGKGTSTADASGNGNAGTLLNGTSWTTGKMGNALLFDGVNDYVVVPNSASLNISGKGITLSFWINITNSNNGSDYVIIGKPWIAKSMTYPYYQYAVEFDNNGGKALDFMFTDPSGTFIGPFSMTPSLGVWTYVAFTYNGTVVKGYLDGVEKLSVAATQSIQARGNNLLIGVDGAFGQAFKGKLDEVRLYNRALTATEIQADMQTAIK